MTYRQEQIVAEEITAEPQRDDEILRFAQDDTKVRATFDVGPISWWSWRPGIKPRNALLIGGLISCMALLMASIGLIALLSALEHEGQHALLPGESQGGVFFGSVALLLLGLIFLSYPAVLANWGWLDLYGHNKEHRRCEMMAKVVGLRAAVQTRASRTGLTPRPSRTWYGVALYPMDAMHWAQSDGTPSARGAINRAPTQRVMTFAISEHVYRSLHESDVVRINYSYYLHYVYTLEALT
jgi:hypothetical protein